MTNSHNSSSIPILVAISHFNLDNHKIKGFDSHIKNCLHADVDNLTSF